MTECTFDPLGTGNHSDDLVAVWHGTPVPLVVCGYHAAYWTPGEIVQGLEVMPARG